MDLALSFVNNGKFTKYMPLIKSIHRKFNVNSKKFKFIVFNNMCVVIGEI